MADVQGIDLENPHPCIHSLFSYYNQLYFQGQLGACSLKWSTNRMTLCAGVCHYSAFGGCDIRLSEPILKFRPTSDVKNTLLHEMIHAYLFLTNGNKDHDDHGPCFQNMMMVINGCHLPDEERPQEGYAITVFHKFSDEVALYRVHHWRCVNCADLIKRATNRTPSASDCFSRSDTCSNIHCHWHMHKKLCGGSYEKIHEPPGYVDKRKQSAAQATAGNKGSDHSAGTSVATLTIDGQKRKHISSNAGVSKKATKGPLVQAKTASLQDYFHPVEKDEQLIACRETTAVPKDTVHDRETEGTIVNVEKHVSVFETNEENSVSLPTSSAQRRSINTKTDQGKSSRRDRPGKEASGSCLSFSRRKAVNIQDNLQEKQVSKNPLVILGWANWASYESDEENEEPLINKRTEKRNQVRELELSQTGKVEVNQSQLAELVAAEVLRDMQCPVDPSNKYSVETNLQRDSGNDVEVPTDDKGKVSGCKNVLIDLSDDEEVDARKGEVINCIEKQTLDKEEIESSSKKGFTGPTKRKASKRGGDENFPGKDSARRRRGTSQPDVVMCPVCSYLFKENERNADLINRHVNECLNSQWA